MSAKIILLLCLGGIITTLVVGEKALLVRNLAWVTTDETLKQAFENYGKVLNAQVVRDRDTGRSRGFGFVKFEKDAEADAAIAGLNNQELDGKRIQVADKNSPRG